MPKLRASGQDKGVGPAARGERRWVVVSYDIPDDKRRTKIMKTIEGYGRRVQYSVFECDIRPSDLRELERRLHEMIDQEIDDVRLYQLCESCQAKVRTLGKAERHMQSPYRII